MRVPNPEDAPETPDWTTVQPNVDPATLLERPMEGLVPEQIAWDDGEAVITGIGLTVIITDIELPVQLLTVGVTV